MKIPPEITKINLTRLGDQVSVDGWAKGWTSTSDRTSICETYHGRIETLLHEFELLGFCVWMPDSGSGRALRGEIARIDFSTHDNLWIVKKFPYGWTAKTPAIKTVEYPGDFDFDGALGWCSEHGWTVRTWPGGARAWRHEIEPVRERATILSMRNQVQIRTGSGQIDSRKNYDLAYDF